MRFDPQAGFTPTEDGGHPTQDGGVPSPRNRAARIFLMWMIMSAVALGGYQFVWPIFGPEVLHAIGPSDAEDAPTAGEMALGDRLEEALKVVAQRNSVDVDGRPVNEWSSHAAFEAPVNVDADALLAMIDEQSADEAAHEAWREEAEQARAALEMAERLMAQGKYADACLLLKRVLEHSPNDAQVHYKLGLACVMRRDYDGARQELATLRSLDPSLASLLSNLVPKSS